MSTAPRCVLVVPVGEPADTALVAAARAAGWHLVVAARDRGSLPVGCGAVLTVGPGGRHLLESPTGPAVPLVADGVGSWWAERVSRALAPVRCAEVSARSPSGAVPDQVGIDDVLPAGATDPDALVARWDAATARGGGLSHPVAAVGAGPDGVHRIDLVGDGPHVLVGGTTGSGKSEFLRTLVASLAVSCPPRDLNLVLVDFKGGAAFGPCAELPHVVGVVTDLDDHLASRALASLRAELRRRERLLADAGAPDLEAYARSPLGHEEPLPRLVVVVDELRTLVDEVPDFVSGLVRVAAQGRSLGIHLVLATQRPAGAVTAEVQANVSLRIAFRVRDRSDSVAVVEDGAAADISPHTPGRAVARGADGHLRAFQSAIIGAQPRGERPAWIEVLTAGAVRRHGPVGAAAGHDRRDEAEHVPRPGGDPHPGADPGPDLQRRGRRTRELVQSIAAAQLATGAPAPRRPWLPPLPRHVTLAESSRAAAGPDPTPALGLLDEPDLQRVAALTWHSGDGTWLVSGRPRSGRTTALRALVGAACAVHGPESLHVHLVDPSSCLADLATLPHAGTHVTGSDHRALAALVDHLRAVVATRRAGGSSPVRASDAVEPTVLVVVDGWEQLTEAHEESTVPGVAEDLVRVLRDGSAVGVVGAVAGGRTLLQPRWAGLGGSTVLLGQLDPLDVALAGLRAADVPRDPPPGRGIRLQDRREVQFALVPPAELAARARTVVLGPGSAWRHRPLPQRVAFPRQAADRPPGRSPTRGAPRVAPSGAGGGHALGVFGEAHDEWAWRPEVHGRSLLVAGPGRSGRTNALRVLMSSVAAGGRAVVLVTRMAPPGGAVGQLVDRPTTTPAGSGPTTVIGPSDVDSLVAARRHDPRLAVLVDDADLLDGAPVAEALHEVVDLVDRDDGLVAVVSTSASLATRFRGLDVVVARRRAGLLLQPGPGDLDLLGAPRTRGIPTLPGRGLFVGGGSATEVQVYLAPS